MSIALWPHQRAAITAVRHAIDEGRRSGLVVAPTGSGKTVTYLTLARELNRPTLVLVHRDELVRQATGAAAAVWPEAPAGVVQGARDDWEGRRLVVASVPWLQPPRLERMPPGQFGLVIADEVHHLPAPMWSAAVAHFEPGFLLGLTATPDRLDGRGLAPWFGPEPVFTYAVQKAVADGVLVPVRQLAVRTGTCLDDVAVQNGDFASAALSAAVSTAGRNRAVVEAYLAHAAGRRAVAFAVDRAHVEQLVGAFRAAGVRAEGITGNLPLGERRRVLADFAGGELAVLVNCEICTEGFDDPGIGCVIMARPTRSRGLYQQCVGRGLRTCPQEGKADCLVLDITDNCDRHKLVTATDLFGTEPIPATPIPVPLAEDTVAVPEEPEEAGADGPVFWECEEVPPWPSLPSLAGYRSEEAWHDDPATGRQSAALGRFGLRVTCALTKGEASHLLGQCVAHSEREPATPRQEYALRRAGCWEPGLTKREASRRISLLREGVTC
jgi:superfamily II DNA or RNA helicase